MTKQNTPQAGPTPPETDTPLPSSKVASVDETPDGIDPTQIQRLLEDLRLHQSELEMQNEELRNTQINLTISQRKYLQYYDLAPVGYFSFNEQGVILELNLLASRLIGKSRSEILLGKTPFTMFLAQSNIPLFQKHLRQVYRSGETHVCDLVMASDSGLIIRLQSCLAELEHSPNKICLASATDITEIVSVHDRLHSSLEQLRESEGQFRTLLDSINDSVFVHDFSGRFLLINRAACENLGYSQEELLALPLEGILPPGENLQIEPRLRELMDHGITTFESIHQRADGKLIQVEVKARLVNFRGARVVLSIARDITVRKAAEEATRYAREAAENANRAKSEFLANMSHEIRTPMNSVLSVAGLLLDSPLTPDQRELAEMIRQSGDSLMLLINDILDLSRIEAGKLNLERSEFSLPAFLEELVEILAVPAQEKGIDLLLRTLFGVPHAVQGDPGRLRQVINNLLANAIKFTSEGEVILSVECLHQDDAGYLLRMTVADTGIGIPEDRTKHLFQPFSQVEGASTRKFGGSGLGLSICKRLVELMDGEIGVRSIPGRGSEFWFTCRLGKAKGLLTPAFRPTAELSGQRVLICDPRNVRRQWLAEQLRCWGLDVLEESSTERSIELIRDIDKNGIRHFIFHHEEFAETNRVVEAVRTCPVAPPPNLVLKSFLRRSIQQSELERWGVGASVTCPIRLSALWEALVGPNQPISKGKATSGFRPLTMNELVPCLKERNHRFLVVEDNAMNQKVMVRLLASDMVRIDLAANGAEAVKALELLPYDLVLMDMQMPEMDGYEATRIIRDPNSKVRDHEVPIIAITASAMSQDRERCLAAGVNAYLAKPVQRQLLFSAIDQCLTKGTASAGGGAQPGKAVGQSSPSGFPPPRVRAIKILVVDDNKISLKVAQVLLGRRAETVHLALTGAEALRRVEKEAYDLVFLDLHLPDKDGIEVARLIRATEKLNGRKGAAIFALSASDRPEDIDACNESGMDGFLVKPLSPLKTDRLFDKLFPDR